MKRRTLLPLALMAMTLPATAQTETLSQAAGTETATAAQGTRGTSQTYVFRYGYVNTDSVLHAMPQYVTARKSLADLRQKYDREMKRSEDEFNTKYENFLDAQRDLVPSILHKRQAELQDMMDKNIAFKAEAARLLGQAEKDALAPLHAQIAAAISQVAQHMQLAFVLNAGSDACPYVNPAMSVDITATVIEAVSKRR